MRSIAILGLLVVAGVASAQDATPLKPGQGLPEAVLNGYLAKWEERMAKVTGVTSKCVLTEDDGTEKKKFAGDIAVLKPNYLRLVLKSEDDPKNEKKWRVILVDGTDVWELDYRAKIARVRALPADGLKHPALAVLLGGKAADLQKRYELSIDPERALRDSNYLAISIRPKTKEDQQDMVKAELVLWQNEKDEKFKNHWMLPARLWFQQPNQEQITWLFLDPTPADLIKADFAVPKLPADWKTERQPAEARPVARPR
jgi:TIGR03009 family protein